MLQNKYVQTITLATERDKKVGFASIKIGNITIKGLTVWQSDGGKLRVFFPSYSTAYRLLEDCVAVPPELRSEIEAEVIAAYRTKKREYERGAESAKGDLSERLIPAIL